MTDQQRIQSLERQVLRAKNALRDARQAQQTAEANAAKFHAMLLQARVQLIRQHKQP